MKLINLTPHEIVILDSEGIRHVYPSEGNCRVSVEQTIEGNINKIPLFSNNYGAVEDLPAPQEDVIYIVSLMVVNALKYSKIVRDDVVSPDSGVSALRENGKIVAVRGLIRS
jgi:hypothetical protein